MSRASRDMGLFLPRNDSVFTSMRSSPPLRTRQRFQNRETWGTPCPGI